MNLEDKVLEKLKEFSKTMPHFKDGRINYHNAKKAFVITCFAKYNDEIVSPGPDIKSPIDPFKGNAALAGRKNILITEWGPYDFRSPVIWNTNPTDTTDIMKFDLIGPKGKWKIKKFKGVKIMKVSEMLKILEQ